MNLSIKSVVIIIFWLDIVFSFTSLRPQHPRRSYLLVNRYEFYTLFRGERSPEDTKESFAPWQLPWKRKAYVPGISFTRAAPVIGGESLNSLKPPITIEKYKKLQDLRVVVTVSYTTGIGATRMYKTTCLKIKEQWPDVKIRKRSISPAEQPSAFQIEVDDRVIFARKQGVKSVYLKMSVIGAAIRMARRRKRPTVALQRRWSYFLLITAISFLSLQAVYGDLETFSSPDNTN